MTNNHAIVIDKQGHKIDFVLTEKITTSESIEIVPLYYTLQEGETLIFEDIETALSMIKPRWNGSEWEETGRTPITPKMVEALRSAKLYEANIACQSAIYAGVEIETSQGLKHFSLKEHDQIEITNLALQMEKALLIQTSAIDLTKGVPYHADGELCRFWSIEDFSKLALAAKQHVFYHRAYCNHLRQYINDISEYEKLQSVTYGMDLPPELMLSMAELLS